MLETNLVCDRGIGKDQPGPGEKPVDGRDVREELAGLEERAGRSGLRLAVDHVDGHWRAGFLVTDELGESGFALHGGGPDDEAAVGALARLVD
jgi:hypothetical protein